MIEKLIPLVCDPSKGTVAVNMLRDGLYLDVLSLTDEEREQLIATALEALAKYNVPALMYIDLLFSLGAEVKDLAVDYLSRGRLQSGDQYWFRRWGLEVVHQVRPAGEMG